MGFEVGQTWKRGSGIWATGKQIVEVDNRRSVTFLKTKDLCGLPDHAWISADLFLAWIEASGSTLTPVPAEMRRSCWTRQPGPPSRDVGLWPT